MTTQTTATVRVHRARPADGKLVRRMVFDVLAGYGVPADHSFEGQAS